MRHFKKWQWLFVCLLALALAPAFLPARGRAQAPGYTVTDLGTLGGPDSLALNVNLCGRVVGESKLDSTAQYHPFFWDGSLTDLGTFGGENGTAVAMNDRGFVAGSADTHPSAGRRPFLWSAATGKVELGTLGGLSAVATDLNNSNLLVGESEVGGPSGAVFSRGFVWDAANGMRAVATLGGTSNGVRGVNDAGQMVGFSETGSSEIHAFLLSGETLTDLGVLGTGVKSVAHELNEAGDVVGFSWIAPFTTSANVPYHAFIWSASTGMIDMGTLGGNFSVGYDINNAGQAVGWALNMQRERRAFIYTRTDGMLDLNLLAAGTQWTFTEARAINDSGQIVGLGINPSGAQHAFLLTPQGMTPPCPTPTPTPTPSPTPTPTPTPIPTPTPTPTPSLFNHALAANGATATASSTLDSNRLPVAAINGDRRGQNWGGNPSTGSGWHCATNNAFPDWLEVAFAGPRSVSEVHLFSVQDNVTAPSAPTEAMTFTKYGVTAFQLEYWTGSAWAAVPGATVAGNNKVWSKLTFAPINTTKLRAVITGALAGYSRVAELEAWGAPPPRVNHALASRGATATASSTLDAGRQPIAAINGDRRGQNWGGNPSTGSGWHCATNNAFPDWLEVSFAASATVDEVNLFSVQDNVSAPVEPTATQTFTKYGVTAFQLEYWTGSAWAAVPGATVAGSNKVWSKLTFAPVTTTKLRAVITGALAGYSRIAELEAWGLEGSPPPPPRLNVAAAANGATAAASSTLDANRLPIAAINGDRRGQNWGGNPSTGSGWHCATNNAYPDWLEVAFSGSKTISEVSVFSVQDAVTSPSEPTEAMTFTKYGVTDFDVEYWTGSAWQVVPGGAVTGNNRVWRKLTFAPVTTIRIRVVVKGALAGYSRLAEVEAF